MPVASSIGELEQMLRQQLQNAMQVVQAKAEADMFEEVGSFYSGGSPTIYRRTGGLGSSPRTTGLSVGGNSVSFEAYLEPPSYTVPNPDFTSRGYASYFSPLQAMNAAEYHFANVRGRPGFWQRSEKRIEQDLNNTIASFFS